MQSEPPGIPCLNSFHFFPHHRKSQQLFCLQEPVYFVPEWYISPCAKCKHLGVLICPRDCGGFVPGNIAGCILALTCLAAQSSAEPHLERHSAPCSSSWATYGCVTSPFLICIFQLFLSVPDVIASHFDIPIKSVLSTAAALWIHK